MQAKRLEKPREKVIRRKKTKQSEIKNLASETKVSIFTAIPERVLARFILKDVGYVDVKDKDTFEIARAYLKVLAKKLGINEGES